MGLITPPPPPQKKNIPTPAKTVRATTFQNRENIPRGMKGTDLSS
jgi:hypothetical protein